MVEPRSPEEVVRALTVAVGRLVAGRLTEQEREAELDRLAGLYAENTDVRHPSRGYESARAGRVIGGSCLFVAATVVR